MVMLLDYHKHQKDKTHQQFSSRFTSSLEPVTSTASEAHYAEETFCAKCAGNLDPDQTPSKLRKQNPVKPELYRVISWRHED